MLDYAIKQLTYVRRCKALSFSDFLGLNFNNILRPKNQTMGITPSGLAVLRSALLKSVFCRMLACFGFFASCIASAAEDATLDESPHIALHGFGTLGMTRTDNNNNAQFVRDLTQPNGATKSWTAKVDSILGLQANIKFCPQTEGVVQVVSRYHYDDSYDPELSWAFLRHDFSPDFSLRAGRLGTEFYMLGDSRLVGYSNVSIRPPLDFYGSLVFSNIDGLDISATFPVGNGLLNGKLYAGYSPEKVPFLPGLTWSLKGSALLGGYLDYLNGPWQLRLSHARSRFENELPTDDYVGFPYLSMVPEMAMANQSARFNSVGLVYDQGPLNVQMMLNHIKQESVAYQDSKAGYVLAAYRFGRVMPYLGFSRSVTRSEPLPLKGIPVLDFTTASLIQQTQVDQHTFILGSRWDLQKNLALKAQIDVIKGDPSSTFLFKFATMDKTWDGDMTVYSLALDFVF